MLKMIGAPKLVEIRRIHVDGAAPVDMEKENVKEIERSIRENGNTVINPSWVDKKTSRIVQGRDRILAQMRFRKCALVQYVSGTEEAPDAGPCQTWGVVGTIGPQLGATPAACANCENGC